MARYVYLVQALAFLHLPRYEFSFWLSPIILKPILQGKVTQLVFRNEESCIDKRQFFSHLLAVGVREWKAASDVTWGWLSVGPGQPDVSVKSSGPHPPPGWSWKCPPAMGRCLSTKNLSLKAWPLVKSSVPQGLGWVGFVWGFYLADLLLLGQSSKHEGC